MLSASGSFHIGKDWRWSQFKDSVKILEILCAAT